MNAWLRCCASALLLLAPLLAWPHAASQAYLTLEGQGGGTQLRADLALRDLDAALQLDADGDGLLRWGELRRAEAELQAFAQAGIRLAGCSAAWQPSAPLQIEQRGDGPYAVLQWRSECAPAPLRYTLFATLDPTHRALLRSGAGVQLLDPTAPAAADPPAFWREGMHHLVTGYDHLLFLLCLLLPAVLRRAPQGSPAPWIPVSQLRDALLPMAHPSTPWRPVERLRDALLPMAGIVSAFTLAHSLTLGLAAAGWLLLPGALVEPLIAASIVLAALDNLRPFLHRLLPRWGIAFAFGLVHGFGFAGVLAEIELPAGQFAWALLQFNLGLEAAQLAVVAVAATLLFALRRWAGYPRWVLGSGSGAAALLGLFWITQRV